MNIEKEFNDYVWFVIQKIKRELLALGGDNRVYYELDKYNKPDSPSPERQIDIVYTLCNLGICEKMETVSLTEDKSRSSKLDLKINYEKFDYIYNSCNNDISQTDFNINIILGKIESGKYREKKKPTPKLIFKNEKIFWNGKNIPFKGGQGRIMQEFFNSRKELYGKRVARGGCPVKIDDKLKRLGGFETKESFLDAINKIKNKLKKNGIPATIKKEYTKHYILEIQYKDYHKKQ